MDCVFSIGDLEFEGEHTIRRRLNCFADCIAIEDADLSFKTIKSECKNGIELRSSPIVYVKDLHTFAGDILTKLDQ